MTRQISHLSPIDNYYLFKVTDQFLKQILPPAFLCIQSSKIDRVSFRKVLEMLSANQIKRLRIRLRILTDIYCIVGRVLFQNTSWCACPALQIIFQGMIYNLKSFLVCKLVRTHVHFNMIKTIFRFDWIIEVLSQNILRIVVLLVREVHFTYVLVTFSILRFHLREHLCSYKNDLNWK